MLKINPKMFNDQLNRQVKISISTSAFRNQGKKGLIKETQEHLKNKNILKRFSKALKTKKYSSFLNVETNKLCKKARGKGIRWGTARKGLNIFFRDVLYNSYFLDALKLNSRHGSQLEIPLDSKTMNQIRKLCKVHGLNKMYKIPKLEKTAIKKISKKISDRYQKAASVIASDVDEFNGYHRVDLDMRFWAD